MKKSLAQTILNELKQTFPKEIQKNEKTNIIKLKKSAEKMLKKIGKAANAIETQTKHRYNYYFKDANTNLKNLLAAKDQEKKGLLRQAIQLAIFDFEEDLNKILERDIRLVLVDETGSINITSKDFNKEIYKNIVSDFKIAKSSFLKIKKEGKDKNVLSITPELYFNVYNEAKKRYDETLEDSSFEKRQIYASFIYWRENSKRIYAFVQSKGSLAEAYVASYFYQDQLTNNMEIDLKNFYINRVSQVDNASEILHGDVGENESLQFAVKASGASFGGYQQWINLAQKILQFPGDVNKQVVEQLIKETVSKPALINSLTDKMELLLKEALGDVDIYKG